MHSSLNEDLRYDREFFVNALRENEISYTRNDCMSGPIHWFSFKNHDGESWRTEVTSHEYSEELRGETGTRGYAGITIPQSKIILIDTETSRNVQDYITLHELMHASLDGVNGIAGKAEEKVITEMAPRLYPILRKFGLRWPDRPEGFESLERRARRKSK